VQLGRGGTGRAECGIIRRGLGRQEKRAISRGCRGGDGGGAGGNRKKESKSRARVQARREIRLGSDERPNRFFEIAKESAESLRRRKVAGWKAVSGLILGGDSRWELVQDKHLRRSALYPNDAGDEKKPDRDGGGEKVSAIPRVKQIPQQNMSSSAVR